MAIRADRNCVRDGIASSICKRFNMVHFKKMKPEQGFKRSGKFTRLAAAASPLKNPCFNPWVAQKLNANGLNQSRLSHTMRKGHVCPAEQLMHLHVKLFRIRCRSEHILLNANSLTSYCHRI